MTILVTGASGFVGDAIRRHLAITAPDERLVCTDLAWPVDEARCRKTGEVAALDVTDRMAVERLFDGTKPDRVIHAAAVTRPDARLAAFDVNLVGTLNVLEAADRHGATRVIVASSSGVYAAIPADVRRETDATHAANAYAASKIAAEAVTACYGSLAVRIGPVYGPAEAPRPSRPRMSAIGLLLAALREDRAVTVAGADVARDWTHADDVARGIVALLDAAHPAHVVYNLACGISAPFRDVVAVFEAHGLRAKWTNDAEITLRPTDARPALSIERLVSDTGFAPRHTVQTGIAAIVAATDHQRG